jgi:hypothetical protein
MLVAFLSHHRRITLWLLRHLSRSAGCTILHWLKLAHSHAHLGRTHASFLLLDSELGCLGNLTYLHSYHYGKMTPHSRLGNATFAH